MYPTLCWLSMLYFVTGSILGSAKVLHHEKLWPLEMMNENTCTRILCPTRQNVCLKVSSLLRTSPTKSFTMDIKDCNGPFLICLPDVTLTIVADSLCKNDNSKSHENILRKKRHLRRQSENVTEEEPRQPDGCQTTCTADKEMVCGRDAHHIYKTFISMCDMRAYNCLNPNDKMELAFRKGCLLLSPVSVGIVLKRPAEVATTRKPGVIERDASD